ncbi:hypothetical protein [Sphingomonas koreensis]
MLAAMLIGLAAQGAPAALPEPSPALCRDASEKIENQVGYLLRQPPGHIDTSRVPKEKREETTARLAALTRFQIHGRPIAEAMSARFPPRPREAQGEPDPRVAGMDYDALFAFSDACLARPAR